MEPGGQVTLLGCCALNIIIVIIIINIIIIIIIIIIIDRFFGRVVSVSVNHEVAVSIPDTCTILNMYFVWNGVYTVSWIQLGPFDWEVADLIKLIHLRGVCRRAVL